MAQIPANQITAAAGEKYGIENLKVILGFILYISYQLADIVHKFNFSLAIQLAFYIAENKALLKKAKPALLELKDLNESETKELTAFFNINFDLTNDTLEERIEKGVDFIPEAYALLKQNIDFYIRVKGWINSWGQTDKNAIKSLPQKIKLVA